jgi:branched-chain amino acid aminotransferase
MLYAAEELFFSGTAVEVSPIGSIDRLQVGGGGRGPITHALQDAFFETVRGKNPKHRAWLTYVKSGATATSPAT